MGQRPWPRVWIVIGHDRRCARLSLGMSRTRVDFDRDERLGDLAGKDLAAAIGQTKDFQGATGVTTINEKRDAVKSAVMLELKDGRPQYISTVKP